MMRSDPVRDQGLEILKHISAPNYLQKCENINKVSITMESILTELPKKIAEYYFKKGDKTGAGIQFAWVVDKKFWYAAVHRFPTDVKSRIIVAKASHENITTCFELLETNWNSIRAALDELDKDVKALKQVP